MSWNLKDQTFATWSSVLKVLHLEKWSPSRQGHFFRTFAIFLCAVFFLTDAQHFRNETTPNILFFNFSRENVKDVSNYVFSCFSPLSPPSSRFVVVMETCNRGFKVSRQPTVSRVLSFHCDRSLRNVNLWRKQELTHGIRVAVSVNSRRRDRHEGHRRRTTT